jgi:hypothetical protein
LADEKISQLIKRFRPPYIRDVLRRFRCGGLAAKDASAELNLSRARFYKLYASFLRACAQRTDHQWSPGSSGGAHRKPWPKAVLDLVTRLLRAKPPCSYSLVASEALRRFRFQLDRATVRRFALRHHLAPPAPERKRPTVRRWQTQRVGQLWQYDASPHRWLVGQDWQPSLLHLIGDHSRLIVGARLYERETLLAHLEFLNHALLSTGLPLCLYVDYHSFFFSQLPEAHTQLAAALAFYDVSLRFAPTPQAKEKSSAATSSGRNARPLCSGRKTSQTWPPPTTSWTNCAATITPWKNIARLAPLPKPPGIAPKRNSASPCGRRPAALGGRTSSASAPSSKSPRMAESRSVPRCSGWNAHPAPKSPAASIPTGTSPSSKSPL